MDDGRRRTRKGQRGADGSFLRAAALSALLHTLAISLVLLAPHRLRSAPPTAYTVEIVDPSALGGKLLAGPIGGGAPAGRRPPRSEQPPPPPERPRQEPEVVAKAEPPESPPRVDDADTVPLALARPTPQPTRQVGARPTPSAPSKPRPTATVAVTPKPRPTAAATVKQVLSPSPGARRASPPSPVPSPKVDERGKREGKETPRPSPASAQDSGGHGQPPPSDIDSQLAAAIKGVESRVEKAGTPGLSGPGGGMGGTERRLDGPPGVGGEGAGGGGTLRGIEFVAYYNQMLSRIKESWAYVGDRADLRVTVRFSILESGEIADIRLVERSGDPGYDASVERAVKRASPLGPPPEAYRKEFADVELTFRPADLRRPPG